MTGTRSLATRTTVAVTALRSSPESVADSPVVPHGTRKSIPRSICQSTKRSSAPKSIRPLSSKGVMSAVPHPFQSTRPAFAFTEPPCLTLTILPASPRAIRRIRRRSSCRPGARRPRPLPSRIPPGPRPRGVREGGGLGRRVPCRQDERLRIRRIARGDAGSIVSVKQGGSVKANAGRVDWKGCGTALITPFDDKGRIDFGALERFVDWQIERGIDFLVPCGTTGESATLSGDERKAVTATVVRVANERVPVIAGAGGNHTAKAVFWARDAAEVGANGLLSVSPMYNKPGPE